MTTTTSRPPAQTAEPAGVPTSAQIAALIADAPVPRPTLLRTFNAMIERLERSFDEVRRFTADAAHELRTPLAAMRTEAEVALRSSRSAERDQRVLENLLEEMERLTRLVTQLLFLCREDAGIGSGAVQTIDLGELVREVGEHMSEAIERASAS